MDHITRHPLNVQLPGPSSNVACPQRLGKDAAEAAALRASTQELTRDVKRLTQEGEERQGWLQEARERSARAEEAFQASQVRRISAPDRFWSYEGAFARYSTCSLSNLELRPQSSLTSVWLFLFLFLFFLLILSKSRWFFNFTVGKLAACPSWIFKKNAGKPRGSREARPRLEVRGECLCQLNNTEVNLK